MVEQSREVSQVSPEIVVGCGSTPTQENTSKGFCCWSILGVLNLTTAMSKALYMDPPDHMKLEPTTCSLSGVIPEVNDPPMIAAVEGTAWVQSGSISHSCLRQCSVSQRHIRKSFMQTGNLSNTLIPLVHHLSLSYYIQQTSQRYLIALCEHFYLTVWSPSPDNQQNQNNYYTVAQQDEQYKGTPLRTSSQTVCYMLSMG